MLDYPNEVRNELVDRATWLDPLHEIADRDLTRFYRLLSRELETLHFNRQEAMILWQAVRKLTNPPEGESPPGSLLESTQQVWRLKFGMADTLEVDGDQFLERIGSLSPSQEAAVIDALERMWTRIRMRGWDRIPLLLAEVGLSGG